MPDDDTTDILAVLRDLPVEGALCRSCRRIRPLVDSIHTPYCAECVAAARSPHAPETRE